MLLTVDSSKRTIFKTRKISDHNNKTSNKYLSLIFQLYQQLQKGWHCGAVKQNLAVWCCGYHNCTTLLNKA